MGRTVRRTSTGLQFEPVGRCHRLCGVRSRRRAYPRAAHPPSPSVGLLAPSQRCGTPGYGSYSFNLTVGKGGSVSFTAPGSCALTRCSPTCSKSGYTQFDQVHVTAHAQRGYRFVRWRNGCQRGPKPLAARVRAQLDRSVLPPCPPSPAMTTEHGGIRSDPKWLIGTIIAAVTAAAAVGAGLGDCIRLRHRSRAPHHVLGQPTVTPTTYKGALDSLGRSPGGTALAQLRQHGFFVLANITAIGYNGESFTVNCAATTTARTRPSPTTTPLRLPATRRPPSRCWLPRPGPSRDRYTVRAHLLDKSGEVQTRSVVASR